VFFCLMEIPNVKELKKQKKDNKRGNFYEKNE
jgi:hypothetical protein